VTAEERARVREIVERTCKEQGIPLVVPAEVCAEVARLIAVAQGREGGGRREPAA
jgi:hypothetical protein